MAGWGTVVDLVRARGAVAQLCVWHNGKPVLDETFGCRADALFTVFSVSKPFVALLVHQLASRGHLRLDDPVCRHWPEFARNGKQDITARHVLAHRAGIPYATGGIIGDAVTMTNWRRSVRAVERARPRWPAGQVSAYHVLSYGFVLGEMVRRLTGSQLPDLLRTELLDPIGLTNIHLGLPVGLGTRRVPLRAGSRQELVRQFLFNRPGTARAVIPAAGIHANARDLARFYQMLLCGGELNGVRVLASDAVSAAKDPFGQSEMDRILRRQVRWGHGFELGGPEALVRPMGRHTGAGTFGHNGSSICNAWADPANGLVFVYLTNLAAAEGQGLRHQCAVSDSVRAAVA